jgi:hypothetical protein
MIKTLLIDAVNFDDEAPHIIKAMQGKDFIGLDTETQDSNRHEGLNTYCGYREDGSKPDNTKLVFDMRRTIMTGLSIWIEDDELAYYFNLNHADVKNRIPWSKVKTILDAKPKDSYWVIHNASFELTVFTGQGGIKALIPALLGEARYYDPDSRGDLPNALAEVVYKILAKESDAAHSYNGYVKEIAYGYGLKQLVKRFFHYQMSTFKETLGEHTHMGMLTGEQTAAYGAEDAYWALRLFRKLMEYMATNCPDTIPTFFEQENQMVRQYSDIWVFVMKVNVDAIWSQRDAERAKLAQVLREMKETVRKLLPFSDIPHEGLMADAWYAKNYAKYRKQIEDWAKSPDFKEDDYAQAAQVRGPVSNAWATDEGKHEPTGPNFSHYMPIRTLIYDLTKAKVLRQDGKIQSDGEARGKLKEKFEGDKVKLIDSLSQIAGIEQRMKLYLRPYTLLMDPETGRLYPNVSSMLASRRMAASYPNPMQLAKRGESTYVRGFFEADYDDHVIVSIDWSSIELVEIGELSGDPEFYRAYGQIPHADLHAGSASDILVVGRYFRNDMKLSMEDLSPTWRDSVPISRDRNSESTKPTSTGEPKWERVPISTTGIADFSRLSVREWGGLWIQPLRQQIATARVLPWLKNGELTLYMRAKPTDSSPSQTVTVECDLRQPKDGRSIFLISFSFPEHAKMIWREDITPLYITSHVRLEDGRIISLSIP